MTAERVQHSTSPRDIDILEQARARGVVWLQEELQSHPGDTEAAVAGFADRVVADQAVIHALASLFGRSLLSSVWTASKDTTGEPLPPLIAELDRVREEISGGRVFPCAADVLRQIREEDDFDWTSISEGSA